MQLVLEIHFIFVISNDSTIAEVIFDAFRLLNLTKFPELKGHDHHFGDNLCACFIIYKQNFLIRA